MPKTILVVEDDGDLCTLLEYNLSRSGYRVELLHQLQGGLERAQKLRPDLIILDVMLPDGDGFDFCRKLRAEPSLAVAGDRTTVRDSRSGVRFAAWQPDQRRSRAAKVLSLLKRHSNSHI